MSKRTTKTRTTKTAPAASEQVEAPAPQAAVEQSAPAPLVLVPPPSLQELKDEEAAAKAYLANLRARTAEVRAAIKDEKRVAREAKRAAKGLGPQTGPVAQARAELRAAIAAGVVNCDFAKCTFRGAEIGNLAEERLALFNDEIDALVASILASVEKAKTEKRAAAKARKQAKAAA